MIQKNISRQDLYEFDENYPKDALYMFAENEPVMTRNESVQNDLPGELYTIEVDDKIPEN